MKRLQSSLKTNKDYLYVTHPLNEMFTISYLLGELVVWVKKRRKMPKKIFLDFDAYIRLVLILSSFKGKQRFLDIPIFIWFK